MKRKWWRVRGWGELCYWRDVEVLEGRLLLSGVIEDAAVTDVLTKTDRQELLDNWTGGDVADLQAHLDADELATFDGDLLAYMRGRGSTFFFDPDDTGGVGTFIGNNFGTVRQSVIDRADDVVDNDLFPFRPNSGSYTMHLPGEINWLSHTAAGSDMDFLHTLNRHAHWVELAQAHVYTGDAKYVTELIAELASWSDQTMFLADVDTWVDQEPLWWLLDAAIRADNWTWTYHTVLESTDWTAEANTLFLHRLYQHGDFLSRVTAVEAVSNWTVLHGKGLLDIGVAFGEFADATSWADAGRGLLFDAMDAQIYSDGGHVEQTPNYMAVALLGLLEPFRLDEINGTAWGASRDGALTGLAEAYYQMMHFDGMQPAISDGFRTTGLVTMARASLVLDDARFPLTRVSARDTWVMGTTAIGDALMGSLTLDLTNRGENFALGDNGYYVARSGNGANDRQLIFDVGPKGFSHGHLDMLNFELVGFGKPLVVDPGFGSGTSGDLTGTAVHNTISIGGASHAPMEGSSNGGIVLDDYEVGADGVRVGGHHHGYGYLDGRPVVGRSIWYDRDSTMIVVDFGSGNASHTFTTSFNLPTRSTSALVDGRINTLMGGGDVLIETALLAGQTASTKNMSITVDPAPAADVLGKRVNISQTGEDVFFATLIHAYDGGAVPNISISWVSQPVVGQTIRIELDVNGATEVIEFDPPNWARPAANGRVRGTFNDVAIAADGTVHMVFHDLVDKTLKYSQRDADGDWTFVETIDNAGAIGGEVGPYVAMALNSLGEPGVAYYDAHQADLKYAWFDADEQRWQTEVVDSRRSVGLYPSIQFSGSDRAVISYYDKTNGNLKLASSNGLAPWTIELIDSVGDVGRYSDLKINPNWGRFAMAYENTTTGTFHYAFDTNIGWQYETFDSGTLNGGGYVSLAYDATRGNRETVSYYDADNADLKVAWRDGGSWFSETIAAKRSQGLYTSLYIDPGGQMHIAYFHKTNENLILASGVPGTWGFVTLGMGRGRHARAIIDGNGDLLYTSFEDVNDEIELMQLNL